MSSSNSPCAACKCLRRRCTPECVFAPYFPLENPHKFAAVYTVFGASSVSKLLKELNAGEREAAANSLAYEAEYRLGCVGLISLLEEKLKQVQLDLDNAKKESATIIWPYNVQQITELMIRPYNVQQIKELMIRQLQFLEAMVAREQEMMRSCEQMIKFFKSRLYNSKL